MIIEAYGKRLAAVLLTCTGLLGTAVPATADDKKPVSEYKHPACADAHAQCGGVAYANAGGYVVNWVRLSAKGSGDQPTGANTACRDFEKKLAANVQLGEFVQFTVPASCKYQIKIDIKSGDKKDKDLTLTPGCILVTQSAGTTTVNNGITQKKRDFVSELPDQAKQYGEANCKVN